MTNIIARLFSFLSLLLAYIPSRLPIGMTEFDTWAKSVLALSNLPDNDSTRFALASTVPHQKAEHFYVAKIKFVRLLQKSAANQIAGGVMHDLKAKQLAAIEAAKQAEVTAQDGPPLDQKANGV